MVTLGEAGDEVVVGRGARGGQFDAGAGLGLGRIQIAHVAVDARERRAGRLTDVRGAHVAHGRVAFHEARQIAGEDVLAVQDAARLRRLGEVVGHDIGRRGGARLGHDILQLGHGQKQRVVLLLHDGAVAGPQFGVLLAHDVQVAHDVGVQHAAKIFRQGTCVLCHGGVGNRQLHGQRLDGLQVALAVDIGGDVSQVQHIEQRCRVAFGGRRGELAAADFRHGAHGEGDAPELQRQHVGPGDGALAPVHDDARHADGSAEGGSGDKSRQAQGVSGRGGGALGSAIDPLTSGAAPARLRKHVGGGQRDVGHNGAGGGITGEAVLQAEGEHHGLAGGGQARGKIPVSAPGARRAVLGVQLVVALGGGQVIVGVVGDRAQHLPIKLAAGAFGRGAHIGGALVAFQGLGNEGQTVEHGFDAQDGAAVAGRNRAVVEDGPEQSRGVQAAQLYRMLHGDGAQTGRLGLGEQAGGVSVEARGRRRVARIGHGHAEQQPVDGVGQGRGGELCQRVAGGAARGGGAGRVLGAAVFGGAFGVVALFAEEVEHGGTFHRSSWISLPIVPQCAAFHRVNLGESARPSRISGVFSSQLTEQGNCQ